jgi:hypothetical protein
VFIRLAKKSYVTEKEGNPIEKEIIAFSIMQQRVLSVLRS